MERVEHTTMLSRTLVLRVTGWSPVKRFITRSRVARRLVRRFIAGDTLEQALDSVRELNKNGFSVALDQLGENTQTRDEACVSTNDYTTIVNAIAETGVDANISVKLTQLGLDFDTGFCLDNLYQVLEAAKTRNTFVCVDMESSEYVERTLDITRKAIREYSNVGTVIQSYLHRSDDDVDMLIELGVRVRMVKGAYLEPANLAYQDMPTINQKFDEQTERFILKGNFPAIATHDPKRIEFAKRCAERHGIPKERFEFQMLYGIRRDLQDACRKEGYPTRIYVPYGVAWYPYFTRRLAERPANLFFIVKNLFRR